MDESKNDTQPEMHLAFALAHLGMISQAAHGQYRPRPGEIERRQAWLVSYIRNGIGLATDEDMELAKAINKLAGLAVAELRDEAA
jgi:hypothetical protein